MKKTLLIGSFVSVGIAGVLFLSAILFATPVSAGILDGNWDCLPLPVCPPDIGGSHNNHNRQYPGQTRISGYTVTRPSTIHATPSPTPQPTLPPVTNTNNNTNTNTIYVNGGGSSGGSYPYPVYIPSPSYSYPSYSYPDYSYPTYAPSYYQQPTYQSYYVAPLTVSCVANTSFAPIGSQVVWSARVSGGNGYYSYLWTGTEGLYGYNQSVAMGYRVPGSKEASVAVTSNGQSTRAICGPITIGAPVYQPAPLPVPIPPTYPQYPQYPTGPAIDVACYATPAKAKIGQPVTWTAQVQEAVPVASFSWTGTNGLVGSQPSITKYYTSAGAKKATISITLVDGRTSTLSCGAGVTVSSPVNVVAVTAAPPTFIYPPQTAQPVMDPYGVSAQAAAPFFSLNNVPWGWVAFFIILVLFVTVIYLIFNRYKI
ncbi:MAG: hypothetical protein V4481_04420 [Patescibacteria group bacterium]